MLRNSNMAAARQNEAFARAIENMGNGGEGGEGGGNAMNGVMGMMAMNMMQGMMNNGGGFMQNGGQQNAQAPQMQPAAGAPVLGWTCSCGKTDNRGKFCENCGQPKPSDAGWTCSCGKVNQGKFCVDCGKKKPEGAPLYKCDKCGWEPEDPVHPPKFCPECGDIFDSNDIQ